MSDPAAPADTDIDLDAVDAIVKSVGAEPHHVLPILQGIQDRFRYLPESALRRVCEISAVTPAQIAGVASFYTQFRFRPVGRHIIRVCHGTACHVAGAPLISESLRRHLKITDPDEDTTADRYYTVEQVACLGCCSLAPVMMIDETTYGHLSTESAIEAAESFRREQHGRRRSRRGRRGGAGGATVSRIRVGLGSCCVASGGLAVQEAVRDTLVGLGRHIPVGSATCAGMCYRDPLVEFEAPDGERVTYGNVRPALVPAIVRRHVRPRGIIRRAANRVGRAIDAILDDRAWTPTDPLVVDPDDDEVRAFLDRQRHVVLEHRREMNPVSLNEYRAREGYAALERALTAMTPEAVIDAIDRSGLRGRGGAGYPVADKWAAVRRQPDPVRYLIMNGDEGDPGAFMDRMLVESYPYRILEGLTIAAYAVGARQAYLYIRAEYPLALQRIRTAIARATEAGLLGDRIGDTDFSLTVTPLEGAGAFVCGEETGLIASIEGRRGMPRYRPPYPAEHGLWGHPTCINNVETLAAVPWIVRRGPDAFAAMGTPRSKGTKVFALAGRVKRGGLIEVPMGITIREIVEEIGGGLQEGWRFKGVQIGGPSGGCVPARLADTPVDYEALTGVGAMMGSGGLVVLDDATCMVDMARYFLEFTQNESCGRCTFCRVGTKRMLEILERLCAGNGERGDIERLEHLADRISRTSLCGLGRTAPNPVTTTLRYFRDEYEAHIEGRCPAGACRDLIHYTITDACIGCTICAQNCPVAAIEARPYEQHEINADLCVRCGLCASLCPADAINRE